MTMLPHLLSLATLGQVSIPPVNDHNPDIASSRIDASVSTKCDQQWLVFVEVKAGVITTVRANHKVDTSAIDAAKNNIDPDRLGAVGIRCLLKSAWLISWDKKGAFASAPITIQY
ncbi:hypothetical protein [Sphingomonas sp.]|uniref:hypothetical protein n=1 Tax=Sphingomonas sp. TaxID=28214 RepID=UPI002B6A9E1A|nr:hypothetical protein [Sphingomonas sp.]HTG37421.1 hypothetical protein [Sphingomonas sp.]